MSHTVCVDLMLLLASICIFKGNDKIVTRKFERATSNSIFHTKVCILSACSVHWTYFLGRIEEMQRRGEVLAWKRLNPRGMKCIRDDLQNSPKIPNSCKITILVEIEFDTHHTISETVNFLHKTYTCVIPARSQERAANAICKQN